jgi:hypothetical protein
MEPQLPQVCHLLNLSTKTMFICEHVSMCVLSIAITKWFIIKTFGMVIIGTIILRN